MKGHKGKSNTRSCPICPQGKCSSRGIAINCSCEFHNKKHNSHDPHEILSKSCVRSSNGVTHFTFPPNISQGALSVTLGSNACTIISLLTGVSFLNEEIEIPKNLSLSTGMVSMYIEKMINGNGLYELLDIPDRTHNLSVFDILEQISFPVKPPNGHKGIMFVGMGKSSFECFIADACVRPGKKCFIFTLHPDHSFCMCIDSANIAIFDGHASTLSSGAMIFYAPLTAIGMYIKRFHDTVLVQYGIRIDGANFVEIQLV